jgi:hypothetical protein
LRDLLLSDSIGYRKRIFSFVSFPLLSTYRQNFVIFLVIAI